MMIFVVKELLASTLNTFDKDLAAMDAQNRKFNLFSPQSLMIHNIIVNVNLRLKTISNFHIN